MRSEWQFMYEARGLRIPWELRFDVAVDDPVVLKTMSVNTIDAFIRIVPDANAPADRSVDQTGSVFVYVPYTPEETQDFADFVAEQVASKIRFEQPGDFRVVRAIVFCERIPETDDERVAIADTPHWAAIRLVEAGRDVPSYASVGVANQTVDTTTRALISQFNATSYETNPVSRFLGYFRILESVYGPVNERETLKSGLLQSADLLTDLAALGTEVNPDAEIGRLVKLRHQCAHLKLRAGFGFTPADPATLEVVVPEIARLQALAWRAIQRGNKTDC